jgi:catechol 2,3-dioxygenase-like lactoylglutathione lyase family enzyme
MPADRYSDFRHRRAHHGWLVQRCLKARDIPFHEGSSEGAAERGVKAWWHFEGPKRLGVEIFCDADTTTEPLWMLSSGFVTGAGGMGHVAITSRLPEKMLRFWREIFDARTSDYIEENIGGLTLDITFTRFNERHHSVAIAATRGLRLDPIRTRVQHVNLLVATLDDLGTAYRRLVSQGFEIAHEIGQHPNDKEVSFYVVTPSGFELELGWNPIIVEEANWKPADYYGISLWGHKPRKATLLNFMATNAGNLRRGLKSLLRPEYSPLP